MFQNRELEDCRWQNDKVSGIGCQVSGKKNTKAETLVFGISDCGCGKAWSMGYRQSYACGVIRSLIRARCAPLSPAPQAASATSGFPVSLRCHLL